MTKKGGELEILSVEFLEKIFKELQFAVVRKKIQLSGSQDGFDNVIEIVDNKYLSKTIYTECKDYTTELNYTDAIIKLPQIASTRDKIDLVLFISPKRNFTNIFEETRNRPFLESLASTNFKVAFLSPETDIEKYFSLYPDIYKKIYVNDAPILTASDRQQILDQFDKFIFSDQNLRKIIIEENDRNVFIGNIEINPCHIQRSIREEQKSIYEYYLPISKQKTLLTEIEKCPAGIILLGNPGYGKTSELRQLAAQLWESRDTQHNIPVFKSLKNFTLSSNIEDFLPDYFKDIPKLTIIFDGIDEIENIIDFSNKLRNFIDSYTTLFHNKNLRLILSCRTNIYNKYIKNIGELSVDYLNPIGISDALVFLETKYALNLEQHKTFDLYKNREILQNPFYLDLIGNYYKNHKQVLSNKAVLIQEFVNSRMNEDKQNKFRNDILFDKERIIDYTKKIAFSLEAMQKPSLTATEIKKIAQTDEVSLSRNSFLEENMSSEWSFTLKNIQEYFVASILVELSFDDILHLIRIDNKTNKVHPTWHNVITFLLNLISDEDLYSHLTNWLIENDSELLFNADLDRITDEIRSKVLQEYFIKNCIKDGLWINVLKDVATFSECDANIKYLISKILDKSIHRRARISAIKLLSYMTIPQEYLNELKEIIFKIVSENDFLKNDYIYLVQEAILLTKTSCINEDSKYFNQIIVQLRNKDNKEIIDPILSCVPVKSTIDNVDYFLEILDKSIGVKTWNTTPRYGSTISTKDRIFNLFTRITDPDVLLKIYKYSVQQQKNYQFRESVVKEFLEHIVAFFKTKTEFHSLLVEIISNAIIKGYGNYYNDKLLLEVTRACSIEKPIFDIILDSIEQNSDRKHFLADIVSIENFEKIFRRYRQNIINDDFLHQFRNILSHRDFSLSKKFEEYIEARTSYIFKDKYTQEEIDENSHHSYTRDQKNFDVLFDKIQMINQILIIYDYLNKEDLSFKDIDKFYEQYYQDFELQKKVTENAKHILYEILRDYYPTETKLNKADIANEIENAKFAIMYDILNNLPKNENSNVQISDFQKEFIKQWCYENTVSAKEYYANHLSIGEIEYKEDYYIFEAIYKFQLFFNFDLDETLLLDMIWFNSVEKGIQTNYMKEIVQIEKINARILSNLLHVELSPSSFCNHLKYCVENNVNLDELNLDLKSKIYDFLSNGHYYYAGELIENFFNKDLATLKQLLAYSQKKNTERDRFIYDRIAAILIKENRKDIVQDFLVTQYFELLTRNIYNEQELIQKLISLNHETAFEKYCTLVKKQIKEKTIQEFGFRNQEWLYYTHAKALDTLVSTFELCLLTPDIEKLFGDHYSPLRICSETITAICKANDESTCSQAIDLLLSIDSNSMTTMDIDTFFLNKLKNEVQESYYIHKSKPCKIADVLKILYENKYMFIS
ncbi:hypothetical protein QQY79_03790 [Flavobacterium tructae]|uniref:NACHT domain-containing protein n=1 Tax=Flavobacterium tructae TaxID=1114873 RepID=UPI00255208F4|nr:hypothetical protein [Flavobacterium tructae]MDL2141631.1 hypothetical protein [Flavobacterium tructae]